MKNKFFKSKKELNLLVERAKNGKAKSQHELAFYYYTKPEVESEAHNTIYVERPGEKFKK